MSHREMRNKSGEILRQVAAGESIYVTNHGQVAAVIVPPRTDSVAELAASGQARPARSPVAALRSIARRKTDTRSDAIVSDVRGRW